MPPVNLAISCIGWNPSEDVAVADRMAAHGCTGVELVPDRIATPPLGATPAQVAAVRAFWESRGIPVVAMQALLFGHPELLVFGETRAQTRDYLAAIIRLGGALGAKALVFGSPRNRARGLMPADVAQRIAVDFFGELGTIAASAGTCLCIEPSPPQYGADFATDSVQALALVEAVGSPGFGLHLDSACALLASEDFPTRLRASAHVLRHVHISEPQLAPVGPGGTADVQAIGVALRSIHYAGYVSIEMRAAADPLSSARVPEGSLFAVDRALSHVKAAL